MRVNLNKNTRIKLIALLSAIVLWMYVMAIIDPEDSKIFENVPVTITNSEELKDEDLVVYPHSDLVADINVTGKLSDLQKINEEDIHIYGSIDNPIEGKNYLYLKVNASKQFSYEFKNDFIIVKLEKLIHKEKDIKTEITGKYKDDVDTVNLQQSSVTVSAPRVLIDKVSHIKASIDVSSENQENLTQKVKLVPVDSKGKEVKGVTLGVKNTNAEITFLEEKQVPINVQLDKNSDENLYELSYNKVTIKGKKNILDDISYINTRKIDSSKIGVSKKLELIIPEGVTSNQDNVIIKPKSEESLEQRIIYSKDDIQIKNNDKDVNISDLNIPDNINVLLQLENINTKILKSDIKLYLDFENSYNDNKEYQIKCNKPKDVKSIEIIPYNVKNITN